MTCVECRVTHFPAFSFYSHAFAPIVSLAPRTSSYVKGYLDDLSSDLYGEVDDPDVEGTTHEATDAKSTDRVSV